jgi:hypothetical protein
MVDITTRSVVIGDEPAVSGASWGAIFAGAAVSLAVTLLVIAFGTGLGLSAVSPWETAGVSATTFKIGTGIFLIVTAMLASSLGGYIAGRLRTRWTGVHTDEVFFRDTAHGFVTWAVATVIGFGILAAPSATLLGGAASGAMQGAGNAASGPAAIYVDQLMRSDASSQPAQAAPAAAPTQQDNAQQGSATPAQPAGSPLGLAPPQPRVQPNTAAQDSRGEIDRMLTTGLQNGGTISADDRSYLARTVARRTGMSQADAEKRVDEVLTKAKSNVDAARKAAAQLSFWLTVSLLIGAFCASIAAAEGGALRDGFKTWRRV